MRWWIQAATVTLVFWVFADLTQIMALQSNSFRIDESFIGGGGLIEETSANFKAAESIGDIAVGESASDNFQTNAGYTTDGDPALAMSVSNSVIDFGELSIALTKTATSNFSVLNYTSYGYIVQIVGDPPKTGNDPLEPINPAGPSQSGVEQYGINLVANTSPVSQGSDPVQYPSNSFSYGAAAAGYNTANNYQYIDGDTVASAGRSSGRTDYTISYIVNASTTTAGGVYVGAQELIVIGTY